MLPIPRMLNYEVQFMQLYVQYLVKRAIGFTRRIVKSERRPKRRPRSKKSKPLLDQENSGLDAQTRRNLASHWKHSDDRDAQKALLRRYSVAELYSIVIEIAKETLNERQRSEFLRRVTDRLSRG